MFSELQDITYPSSIFITATPVFLKLGSANFFQGFREIKMCNGRTVLLVVLNLYIWIKIHVATFDTNHSITDSTQSITVSIQKLPDAVVTSVSRALHRWVDVSGETILLSIGLRLAVHFLHVMYIKISKCWYMILWLTYCGSTLTNSSI